MPVQGLRHIEQLITDIYIALNSLSMSYQILFE